MSLTEWMALLMVLLVMGMGIAGSFIPGIPGPPLVLMAGIVHRLMFGEASASITVLIVMTVLMVLALVLDYVATLVGARKLGATWRGVVGAGVGGIVGIFWGPVALILGPFIGAVLFELLGGRKLKEASQAGLGAVLGLLAGTLGKLACAVAMTGLFLVSVLMNA
ncbi:MAG: DUF456 domain-containing protein [Verrucomicrobiales bacterium]|nr:DUF456 domain-containing protein [Verrucomicrobiales bacterium]